MAVVFLYENEYTSSRHYNPANAYVFKKNITETQTGFAMLVECSLTRSGLDFGRYRDFKYIVGYDDGSVFVERVSPKCATVHDALDFMIPAQVKKSDHFFRQGDVFFIPVKRKTVFDYSLPHGHVAVRDGDAVKIVHEREHSPLILPNEHYKPVLRKAIFSTLD